MKQQVLEVSNRCESVSRDAMNDVLLKMQKHQITRQTLGDHAQVVIGQVQALQAGQLAATTEQKESRFKA